MEQRDKAGHIRRIRKEYPDAYDTMNWLSPGAAEVAEQVRQDLITSIFNRPDSPAGWRFAGTKLFTRSLSPGCAFCGEGLWSCLFINGVCNANCFYCPSEQKDKGLPITSSIEFGRARDYADYVKRFGIRGVGFSGGEPLLSLARVMDYLQALGQRVNRPLHTWMYTNGFLVTEDRLKALKDSGLKEIRFDLSANDYKLNGLEKAVDVIPIVTVEIPAIPEDLERVKQLIRDLHSAGADFLNLHQIRCTPFNRPKLQERRYTFLHGPGVSVLETELTALELIQYTLEQDIPLHLNYCSFTFRHQFQKAGARQRNAQIVKKTWEDITPTGYIRTLSLEGEPDKINQIHKRFRAAGEILTAWQISTKGDSLSFPARLWPLVDFTRVRLKITYSSTVLRTAASLRYPFTHIRLNDDKKVVIERDDRHAGIRLQGGDIQAFSNTYLKQKRGISNTDPSCLSPNLEKEINRFETFTYGLAPYF
jgi:pyruvate formate-lyase activating enzyme-like uncharacterized protein